MGAVLIVFTRGDYLIIDPILIRVGLIDVMITDLGIPIQKTPP